MMNPTVGHRRNVLLEHRKLRGSHRPLLRGAEARLPWLSNSVLREPSRQRETYLVATLCSGLRPFRLQRKLACSICPVCNCSIRPCNKSCWSELATGALQGSMGKSETQFEATSWMFGLECTSGLTIHWPDFLSGHFETLKYICGLRRSETVGVVDDSFCGKSLPNL